MRHETVKVKRDGNTMNHISVAPWEVPILDYLYDEGNVTRVGTFVDLPDREYPDPAQEMERLSKVYGSDPETKEVHAVAVYGSARAGVKALKVAIDEARAEEAAASRKRVKRKAVGRRPSYGDALLA
jgi:hypothetical protein